MKKKLVSCLLILLLLLAAVPFTVSAADSNKLNVVVISDLHVLPSKLVANTADFNAFQTQDLKMISESEAILDAMLAQIRKSSVDVLLIPGDLTCNGELVSHQLVSSKLAQLEADMPNLKVLVINGNHDINVTGKNYNTATGKAVSVASTSVDQFKKLYGFCYNDPCVIARFNGSNGSLSYVARIGNYSFIVIDSNNYGHTDGQISDELLAWIEAQVKDAQNRGDAIVGMMHHGLVPHFSLEPTVLSDFLVDDYDTIADKFADWGISLVFTGHLHTNDIASSTSPKGNTVYDVATGSAVCYPSPIRFVTLAKSGTSVTASVTTRTGIAVSAFTNPYTGKVQSIADLTAYGQKYGYTAEAVRYMASHNVERWVKEYLAKTSSDATWLLSKIMPKLNNIVNRVVALKVDSTHTTLDAVNYIYFLNHAGLDNGQYPAWVQTAVKNLNNGKLIGQIMDIVRQEAFSDTKSKLRFNLLSTSLTNLVIGKAAAKVVDSFGNDSNYKADNNTVITFSCKAKTSVFSSLRSLFK